MSVDFSDEGLDDEDLTEDLEAESLPTTDKFSYHWEQVRDNIISVFTFNAEKKAAQYRLRLHNLDRKIAACADIGDAECVAKIQERIAQMDIRAGAFIARRAELQGELQDKFDAWREARAAKITALRAQAAERKAQREELQAERQAKRDEAKENRRIKRDEIRQKRREALEQRRAQPEELRDRSRSLSAWLLHNEA